MIFIMGGNGFVGSAYARLFRKLALPFEIITRENFDSYVGRQCDLFINANGNSVKFLADREPLTDFDASVRSVVRSLTEIRSSDYIFLSSGDVYPDTSSPQTSDESVPVSIGKSSRYGLHKFIAENYVRYCKPDALIFRMGGFVGTGMRKNAVFDMLNNQPLWLDLNSELTFINTDSAARLVYGVYEKKIRGETLNLGPTDPVKLQDIYSRLNSVSQVQPGAKTVRFELNVNRLAHFADEPLPTTKLELEAFFASVGR